jgi:carboxyl-terminal processing protease
LLRGAGKNTLPQVKRTHSIAAALACIGVGFLAARADVAAPDEPPKVVSRVDPIYPLTMVLAGKPGRVTLDFVVDARGAVRNITVASSTDRGFEAAATAALAQWTFKPATRRGKPVAARMELPIEFHSAPYAPPVVAGLPPGLGWTGDLSDSKPGLAGPLQPYYPAEYARAGVRGTVKVDFMVGADGRIFKITGIDSPDPRLTLLALFQLKKATFFPARRDGVPVSAPMRLSLDFTPPAGGPATDETKVMEALRKASRDKKAGRLDDAIADCNEALRIDPGRAAAYEGRASVYDLQKRYKAALADLDEAIRLDPAYEPYLQERGKVHIDMGDPAGALPDYEGAVRLDPDKAAAYSDRGSCELVLLRPVEAMDDYNRTVQLAPGFLTARWLRANLAYKRGYYKLARDDLEEVALHRPDISDALNLLAWILATCPEASLRDGKRAVGLATQACSATRWKNPNILDTLAAASAEAGDFDAAARWQAEAVRSPGQSGPEVERKRARLDLYRRRSPYRIPRPDMKAEAWEELRYHTFQAVWSAVNEGYFDPSFGGVDWAGVREKYRVRLQAADDEDKLRLLLQGMLAELHHTHFAIIPREGAVFNPSERVRVGGIGTEEAFIDGMVVFTAVRAGSPGKAAGLAPGDAVSRVDGLELGPVLASLEKAGVPKGRVGLYVTGYVESRLSGPVGSKVRLEVVGPGGAVRKMTVTCGPADGVWSEPIGSFPSQPIRTEARRGDDGIAVLRFNAFVPQVMKDVRRLLGSLRPGDGLIIDLRGNPGGITAMASGISGLLCRREFTLGSMHMRKGVENLEVYPQAAVFDGPVAILVDGQSASTSEILAAGLKEGRRARVFGELTAGAALPSSFAALPTGDLLQYAIADMTTPAGGMIEGTGVAPDQCVARTRDNLATGRDPVEVAARAWLGRKRIPQ